VEIPGTFDPAKEDVFISGFNNVMRCINSKRKPRRMQMFGNNGKVYDYLLKGHEDLRQDERVM
jgi:FKBP12-rapamycin complex-associated protein